ncbi:MAG: hypothetical protein QMD08_05425 [Actinomycetota bacterium]|nr:hypothetical protein [Actinomycetota bacterium]
MTREEILKKIKERGYWVVNFHPTKFVADLIPSRTEAKQIIKDCSVELRGWDYPHVPTQNDEKQEIYLGEDYVEAYIDWWSYKELWRFHQSGQFVHLFGMTIDWFEEHEWLSEGMRKIEPGTLLDPIATVYLVTEIFEFLRRLALKGIYSNGVKVRIRMVGTNNRVLKILDDGRAPLMMEYKARTNEITVSEKELSEREIIDRSQELALESIHYIFETFDWERQPIETFKSDQQKLLERRI